MFAAEPIMIDSWCSFKYIDLIVLSDKVMNLWNCATCDIFLR